MARVLLIDDYDSFRQLVRLALEDAGHEVAEAANGRVALEIQRRAPADIVITDIYMPEKEGVETVRDLRLLCGDVPIIVATGGGIVDSEKVLKITQHLGADAGLSKPFEMEELLALIDELLRNRTPAVA